MRDDLAPNWERWSLADVGEWVGGGTPSSTNEAYWGGKIPWVSPKDMKVNEITSAQDRITQAAVDNSAAKMIPANSVLLVTRSGILAHSLPVAINRVPVTVNQDLKAIIPVRVIDAKYLSWALRAFERAILTTCSKHGTTVHSVEMSALKALVIPVPPMAEQRRIGAKIEELFSELDRSVEDLHCARRQLFVYRQALLKQAFDGKPTAELPSLLKEPMSNGYSGKPVSGPTRFKVLSLSATTTGVFQRQHYKYLNEEGLAKRDIWCEPGDILVQRGNTSEYVGVPAVYTGLSREFIFPDLMIRLRADRNCVDPRYLYYALSSPGIRNFLRSKAKGSAGTMPKISQAILSSVKIPVCELQVQRSLVQALDEDFSRVSMMEKVIHEETNRANVLRRSILQMAFAGKLVPHDYAGTHRATPLSGANVQRKNAPKRRSGRRAREVV